MIKTSFSRVIGNHPNKSSAFVYTVIPYVTMIQHSSRLSTKSLLN